MTAAPKKLLGVTIDNKLAWDQHISTIIRSSSYRLFMLRRLKTLGLPQTELCNIFKTFILPKLTYASPAWSSSLNTTQLKKLENIQKRATKIILGPTYNDYAEAQVTLSLPSLSSIFNLNMLRFGKKVLKNPRHRHLLPPLAPSRSRAIRTCNKLIPIR